MCRLDARVASGNATITCPARSRFVQTLGPVFSERLRKLFEVRIFRRSSPKSSAERVKKARSPSVHDEMLPKPLEENGAFTHIGPAAGRPQPRPKIVLNGCHAQGISFMQLQAVSRGHVSKRLTAFGDTRGKRSHMIITS